MMQAEADADLFLQENHSFDDYAREVRKYHKLVDDISYNSEKVHSFTAHYDTSI